MDSSIATTMEIKTEYRLKAKLCSNIPTPKYRNQECNSMNNHQHDNLHTGTKIEGNIGGLNGMKHFKALPCFDHIATGAW